MPVGYSIYVEKPSYIHQRLDPRTKMLWLGTVFVLALSFNHPAFLGALMVLLLVIARWAQIPAKSLKPFFGAALWFLILGVAIWPFYIQTGTPVLHLGSKPVTSVGLLFGLAMGLRVALMVTAAGMWMMTTSPQKMTLGLLRMGLPYKAGMAISSAIRFVPLINAERMTIQEAQRARGLDLSKGNSFSRAIRSVAIIGPMLVRALDLAQSLAVAMDARAFGARDHRTTITDIQITTVDRATMYGCVAVMVLALVCRFLGFGVIVSQYL